MTLQPALSAHAEQVPRTHIFVLLGSGLWCGLQAARTALSEGGKGLRGGVKDWSLIYLANWEPGSVPRSPVAATQKGYGVGERVCAGQCCGGWGGCDSLLSLAVYKALGSIPSTRVGEKDLLWELDRYLPRA